MSLSELIKEKRKEAGISMSALARKVGISGNWMSTIERGGKVPSQAVLDQLTEALEDDGGEIHKEAALESGEVTIQLEGSHIKLMASVLLRFRELSPKMTSRALKRINKNLTA